MMRYKLDNEERELRKSLENDEWVTVPDFEEEKKKLEVAAKRTLNKTKRVNIRLIERDFDAAHTKALEEGMPYQTLLASVVHKYLTGRLVEGHRS